MKYKLINKAILSGTDLPKSFNKDKKFYEYLLNNGVAYFYSKIISVRKNNLEKEIIRKGIGLNSKYIKTLRFLHKVCKKNKIPFLLYKTHKYVSEVVDGDIDIFVKEKDFNKFLESFKEEGFECFEDEPAKGKCVREGFNIIEPHTHISWRENIILKEKEIWNNTEKIRIKKMNLKKTTIELDFFSLLIEIFYGPNYIRLYDLLVYKKLENKFLIFKIIKDDILKNQIKYIVKFILNDNNIKKKFPLFLLSKTFLRWWFKYILLDKKKTFIFKIKHLVYFWCWKYRYLIINKLPFRHFW